MVSRIHGRVARPETASRPNLPAFNERGDPENTTHRPPDRATRRAPPPGGGMRARFRTHTSYYGANLSVTRGTFDSNPTCDDDGARLLTVRNLPAMPNLTSRRCRRSMARRSGRNYAYYGFYSAYPASNPGRRGTRSADGHRRSIWGVRLNSLDRIAGTTPASDRFTAFPAARLRPTRPTRAFSWGDRRDNHLETSSPCT